MHALTPHVCVCGVGSKNAADAARGLIDKGVYGLLSWGVAAALVPDLKPGQLLLPKSIVDDGGSSVSADPLWHESALQVLREGAEPVLAPLAESRQLLQSSTDKTELNRVSGACAADMESFAIGRVAAEAGLPFLAVRCVVDALTTRVPPLVGTAITPHGHPDKRALLLGCLFRPWTVVELFILGLAFARTVKALRPVARCVMAGELHLMKPGSRE